MQLPSWTRPRREPLREAPLTAPDPGRGWLAMRVMVNREWRNKQSSSEGLSPRAQSWCGQGRSSVQRRNLP